MSAVATAQENLFRRVVKHMQTRHIFLLLFVFITISVAVFLSYQKKEATPAIPVVESKPLVPLAPTGYFIQSPGTRFSFISTPTLPKTLPAYSWESVNGDSLVSAIPEILQSLGVSATPSSIIRGSIRTTKWSSPSTFSLILTSSKESQTITYQRIRSSGGLISSPELGARRFIDLFSSLFENSSIYIEETGGEFDGLLVLDSPKPKRFSGFSASFVYNNYPFSTNSINNFSASIVTDNSGVVRSATIFIPKIPIAILGSVVILTPEQLLFNLESQRGSIVALKSGGLESSGPNPPFKSFSIRSVSIFYTLKNGLYLPAFFISGEGITNRGARQEASYFLWASP